MKTNFDAYISTTLVPIMFIWYDFMQIAISNNGMSKYTVTKNPFKFVGYVILQQFRKILIWFLNS